MQVHGNLQALCGKGPHWPGHIVLKCHVLLRRALRSLEEAWTPGGGSKLLFQCLSAYAYLALKFAIVSGLSVAAHINYFNFLWSKTQPQKVQISAPRQWAS